jgi:2-succinyl-5-enolpyruvyl-6-hydroxy-3-cyclohexene-1-carboxylate synthase
VTNWNTATATIRECAAHGIREFVVCPGARNALLVEALVRAEAAGWVTLRRHFEERAAGFFALGRAVASGSPCAVVTTSGTAAAELLPAMIEARYQARPLVALTADRPAAFRGSGAPQAIVQPGIFGDCAGTGDLADWDRRSPWHLNVEFDEDFALGDDPSSPPDALPAPAWPRPAVGELARWLREDVFRGLVVMIGDLEPEDREDVFHFVRDLDVPVVAEATGGLREALAERVLPDPDRLLAARPPGKILRLGGVPSGRFWRDLESLPETSVWNVTRAPFPGLARPCQTLNHPVGRALRALGEVEPVGDALDHLVGRSRRLAEIDELLEAHPDSEPGMLRTLSHFAALGAGLFLGNSLPIREWNLFAQRDRPLPDVRANRGANGIDGQLSTWLGLSAADADAWALVGDLTALYDLAAPAMLGQVESRGRVLAVIQNRGGRIFDRLPGLTAMSPRTREIMANVQPAHLADWAAMWDMDHLKIASAEDFDALQPGDRPLVVELAPDPAETREFWKKWDLLR